MTGLALGTPAKKAQGKAIRAENEADTWANVRRAKRQIPTRVIAAAHREADAYRGMAVKAKTLAERAKASKLEREALEALADLLDAFLPDDPKPARRQAGGAPTAPASGLPFEGEA